MIDFISDNDYHYHKENYSKLYPQNISEKDFSKLFSPTLSISPYMIGIPRLQLSCCSQISIINSSFRL